MPIYDFECTQCGYQQELMRKVSAPNHEDCPSCHQPTFAKKVSAPNFQLTGTGWYATDFKTSGKSATASKPAETEAAPAACAPGCGCH